jgi:TolA-binding protein
VAAENFALMNQDITLDVKTRFEHNRLLSNTILITSILLSLLILFFHYKSAARKAAIEDQEKSLEINRLKKLETENIRQLDALAQERQNLQSELEVLKEIFSDEQKRAERDEDDLIEEIESLEKKLEHNIALQDTQQQEISALKEKIATHEKGRQPTRKAKPTDNVKKRFRVLYKDLAITDRAVSGYLDLNEELKLKAEEVIHQLNSDAAAVTIKRKVFGGKGNKTVLEVIFGYKGRLYFRNTSEQRVEVLAIGTKNTQARELEFLARL